MVQGTEVTQTPALLIKLIQLWQRFACVQNSGQQNQQEKVYFGCIVLHQHILYLFFSCFSSTSDQNCSQFLWINENQSHLHACFLSVKKLAGGNKYSVFFLFILEGMRACSEVLTNKWMPAELCMRTRVVRANNDINTVNKGQCMNVINRRKPFNKPEDQVTIKVEPVSVRYFSESSQIPLVDSCPCFFVPESSSMCHHHFGSSGKKGTGFIFPSVPLWLFSSTSENKCPAVSDMTKLLKKCIFWSEMVSVVMGGLGMRNKKQYQVNRKCGGGLWMGFVDSRTSQPRPSSAAGNIMMNLLLKTVYKGPAVLSSAESIQHSCWCISSEAPGDE